MINRLTIAASLLIIAVLGFFVYRKYFVVQTVHYHAGFRIFVDGVLQDFSGPEYMSLKPCGSGPVTPEEEQGEKAHLHDRVGYVVHVHRSGARWQDLLTNIHYMPPEGKPIVGYIDGKQIINILDSPIKPYQSMILLIGKRGDLRTYLQQAVKEKEIKTAESKSEDCGS